MHIRGVHYIDAYLRKVVVNLYTSSLRRRRVERAWFMSFPSRGVGFELTGVPIVLRGSVVCARPRENAGASGKIERPPPFWPTASEFDRCSVATERWRRLNRARPTSNARCSRTCRDFQRGRRHCGRRVVGADPDDARRCPSQDSARCALRVRPRPRCRRSTVGGGSTQAVSQSANDWWCLVGVVRGARPVDVPRGESDGSRKHRPSWRDDPDHVRASDAHQLTAPRAAEELIPPPVVPAERGSSATLRNVTRRTWILVLVGAIVGRPSVSFTRPRSICCV